ncbi:TonB-dependent receptor [Croceicoccus estronivorus]|uniref:TonB-dependent receptor n=1 Tax=Croceicoccus estronivorus TaxID=1172626 RepID=UPI00082B53CF|nr:TonB-dependent receptor [Croceicoccus estronivorus]OCC22916.1 TonB-dependent receptor [Croceicoccus estronivorus]
MTIYRSILMAGAGTLAIAVPSAAFAGEIAGHVSDASHTVALRSAQVRVVELDRVAVADRDGSYRFADVPAGTYTLEVRYVGAETVRKTVDVPATGEIAVDFALGGANAREILVIGQRANQASALSRKREADGVSDVLTRDAVGQFPDQNVAESLRRLPGVNILDDQGEGRFVSVRGLDPELNATSVNGVRLPAPESDVRSVALDVISSDIIESVEVKKSLTPDMDADTIGASIEINTTSAFDRKKDLFTVKVEGSYNDYSGDLTPKGSFDFSTRLGDDVGISGGLSYYKRKFEADNIEADDWTDEGTGIYAQTVEYRDFDVERERISANLGLDVRASDTTSLYVKGIFSQFDDQEYRRRLTFDLGDFKDDKLPTIDGAKATFSSGTERIQVERDIKDRFERQRIRSLVFGGETDTGEWKASYAASWSKSSEVEHGSVDPAEFRRRFEDDEDLSVAFDYSNYKLPMYSVSGADVGKFYDPAEYELHDIEYTKLSNSTDEEYALKLDLGREFAFDTGTFTVQAGGKARWREKMYNKEVEFWENDGLSLADVVGSQTYRITDIEPVATYTGATKAFLGNIGDYELNDEDTFIDSLTDDYRADEDVMAGYLMGRWESSKLLVVGGVRYEHTDVTLRGNIVDEDALIATPIMYKRSYGDWLPSLNVRFEPTDNLVLRAAGYRSLVRPKLSKLAPRISVNEDDEYTFGNPFLKPFEAWNFDLSAEYYFSSNGALSGAFFYKDVKNFIVDTKLQGPGTFGGIDFLEDSEVPINGGDGKIFGLELSYSQALTMLPAPLDGLLVQANYTYTDATGHIPVDKDITDLRKIGLPTTSKHTFNAVLGYEKGPISLRLAGTYRDKMLEETGDVAEEDRYADDHFQLDLSAKYRITKNIQLFYEWININNAKYTAYNNYGGRRNQLQFDEFNWTMKFGAKVNF